MTVLLAEAGLTPAGRFVPSDALIQGDAYFDGRGPLDPAWRRGDSLWSMVSEAELERALDRVRALDDAGTLDAFVAEHDRVRPSIGQIGFHYAIRETHTAGIAPALPRGGPSARLQSIRPSGFIRWSTSHAEDGR